MNCVPSRVRWVAWSVLSMLLILAPVPAEAQSTAPESVESSPPGMDRHEVARARQSVTVDGVLEESVWRAATAIRLPWEASPGDNAEAPVETVCRVTHDADHLYVGCRARDPEPDEIRAHYTDRDEARNDDWIRLLLDPFGDRRRAIDFRVNPLGVQMDARFTGYTNFQWDGIWDSEGRVTDDGYVVEMVIPFRTINFPESEAPQQWGVILDRSWPRSETHRFRSIETNYQNQCLLCQAETLTGLRPGDAGQGLEVIPTFTTTRTDERGSLDASEIETGSVEPEPGFTGSWRFSSNVQLTATVNPDFSQVEADAAQLNANQRFPLFFPEKRPFFQERSDLFQVPMGLIFTRQIADPQAGLKLTGKYGANAVGAFLTRDRRTRLILPGPTSSRRALLDRENTNFVGRWQRDVGTSSSMGIAATTREGADYHNRMIATDARLQLTESINLLYTFAGSHTKYPASVAGTGSQPEGSFFFKLTYAWRT